MICKYCRKKINEPEACNKAWSELSEKKRLALHHYDYIPYGKEIQCKCGTFNQVEKDV